MKCVRNITTKEIKRVAEDRAAELVKKGWEFAPKSAWKESEGTSWTKNATEANPMKDSKVRRQEMQYYRNRTAAPVPVLKAKPVPVKAAAVVEAVAPAPKAKKEKAVK